MARPHPTRHTGRVPRSWLAATLAALAFGAAATGARAQPPPDPDADDQGEFWGAVLAPHGSEVASLLENGRQQVMLAHQGALGRGEPRFRAQRLRFFDLSRLPRAEAIDELDRRIQSLTKKFPGKSYRWYLQWLVRDLERAKEL